MHALLVGLQHLVMAWPWTVLFTSAWLLNMSPKRSCQRLCHMHLCVCLNRHQGGLAEIGCLVLQTSSPLQTTWLPAHVSDILCT